MSEIILNAFVEAVKMENMKMEQVPIPYQEEVSKRLEPIEETGGEE